MTFKINQSTKIVRPIHSVFYGMGILTGGATCWLAYLGGLGWLLRPAIAVTVPVMSGAIFFGWARHPWAKNLRLREFNIIQKAFFAIYLWVISDVSAFYLLSGHHACALRAFLLDYILLCVILWACFSPPTNEQRDHSALVQTIPIFLVTFSLSSLYWKSNIIYSNQCLKGLSLAAIFSFLGVWGTFYLRLDYWVNKYPALRDPDLFFISPEELQNVSATESPTTFFIYALSMVGLILWEGVTFGKGKGVEAFFDTVLILLFFCGMTHILPGGGYKNFLRKIKSLYQSKK